MKPQCDDYIDLIKQKDEQGFNAVYELTSRSVYAIIKSIVKNESITQDLMQDTYVRAIEKINSYKKNGKFKQWINSIAHNLAMDYFRKHKTSISFEEVEYQYKVETNHENKLLVEALLKTVSPLEKEIVLLRVIDELSFKEIALITQKPLGTVLWLYNKAIKKMRMEGQS
ncbi:MAG: RNA polymerase sigma factor [Acholeplasma sp.]|nr:RNA polymerase sigma factor [Acholeplasma sp.]